MTKDEMQEIARGNIERHLGDVADECGEPGSEGYADSIYDEAYTLGFDALHDAGVNDADARRVAQEIAMRYAQP